MLADQPNDPFLHYALALEYISMGDEGKAAAIFEDLIHKHPDYHATYYHYAKQFERLNNEEKAIEFYEKGIELTKRLNERHAYNELRSALDELLYD